MCTNDTRDQVSIDGSDRHLDRHVGLHSVEMLTNTWSTLDQQQAIGGRVLTESVSGESLLLVSR